jgi:hypothetical protein
MYVTRAPAGAVWPEPCWPTWRLGGEAGCDLMVRETGRVQPEALALYRSAGYVDIALSATTPNLISACTLVSDCDDLRPTNTLTWSLRAMAVWRAAASRQTDAESHVATTANGKRRRVAGGPPQRQPPGDRRDPDDGSDR